MSIKLLDENTINKIAAGEVIENPSNVVKELVENSIDSGAKNISVEIKDGGTSFIRISDDGSGFNKEDISLAFLQHATSKLEKIDDLYDIVSYGFRGEALSSIASVAKVNLITKTDENDIKGYKYTIEYGKNGEIDSIAANKGSVITVENLFMNVPVRKKFLKSIARETANVEDIVVKFSITRPDITFKFITNGVLKYKSNGDGELKNILYNIYGKNIYDNLLEVGNEISGVHVRGYIARPIVVRNNKNDEVYFVNNRYVKDKIISNAIEGAYSEFLMQHKFPLAVLIIDVDKKIVDVNVHPKKAEVRFASDDSIYYAVYNSLYNVLKKSNLIHNETLFDYKDMSDYKSGKDSFNEENVDRGVSSYEEEKLDIISNGIENRTVINIDDLPSMADDCKFNSNIDNDVNNFNSDNENEINKSDLYKNEKIKEEPFITKTLTKNHKYIGQIFDTYILVEYENKLYIIDQHAAHEKINFEKLMSDFKNNKIMSQKIFPSIILQLTPLQFNVVNENIDEFKKLGYEIEAFGDNDVKIDAVPYNIFSIGKKEFLMDIIDNFVNSDKKNEYDSVVEKIASMSCKSAIKANHKLTEEEVKLLLRELFKLDNPYNCPHGRPTIISLDKNEFEKKFGRIV